MKSLNRSLLSVTVALSMLTASPAWDATKNAQDNSTKEAAAPSQAQTRSKNLQEYVALMRADVRQQKAELLGAVVALSASDAAKFWPIYNDYDAQLTKLNDQRVANIEEYARTYNNMTDDKADELIQKSFEYQKERADLLAETYGQVKDAVGATTAARFTQVEYQLLVIIDLQIAASLPIVGQGS